MTNEFYVVISLFEHPEIEVIHTGGLVDKPSASSSGRLAANTLSSINLDIFFMSTAEAWWAAQPDVEATGYADLLAPLALTAAGRRDLLRQFFERLRTSGRAV